MLNAKFVGWMGAGILSVGLLTGTTLAAKAPPAKVGTKKSTSAHVQKTSAPDKKSSKRNSKTHPTSSKGHKHASKSARAVHGVSGKHSSHKSAKGSIKLAKSSKVKSKGLAKSSKSKH